METGGRIDARWIALPRERHAAIVPLNDEATVGEHRCRCHVVDRDRRVVIGEATILVDDPASHGDRPWTVDKQ